MEIFFTICFVLLLLYHSYTDFKEMLLYDKITLALAAVGLLRAWLQDNVANALTGAGVAGGVMLLVYLASRGGMGEGDVKLALVLGLWLGWEQGLLCLLLAFVSGGIIGIGLMLGRKYRRRQPVPFGPFLCGGAAAAYFWGPALLQWYGQQF